ncbi:2Fe-2S iron-sulfur cluster-binding protein [Allochromatium warmingii]|nr:2Fe-2S iron-sulfur cluster-binding protein [Allochromatium warmingii]
MMNFKIEILPDGPTFTAESGETVLRAALRQAVELPNGCRSGHCGACAVTLKGGMIHYPSGMIEALHGQPAGTCLTCQAVAHSDLAIEIGPPPTLTL